jgi:hypothetical protein
MNPLAMAELFGVSTDDLLKVELEEPQQKAIMERPIESHPSKRIVTMVEAPCC